MAPLVPPLLAIVAGIASASALDTRSVWLALPLALAIAWARPRLALIAVFLFGAGIRGLQDGRPPYLADDGLPSRVTATLEGAPEYRPPGYHLIVDLESVNRRPVRGKARISYFPDEGTAEPAALFDGLDLGSGDRIELLVRLRPPSVYRNPGTFDYRRFLERRRIFWTGSLRSPRLVRVLERGWHGPDRIRQWATRRIADRLDANTTVQALALGMVLGQRRRLPAVDERRFEAAGLIHLLVVSGFNLAVVAGAAFWIGRRIRFRIHPRAVRLLFVLTVILGYAGLVEGDAPVTRAATMAVMMVAATALDRGYNITNALAASAILLLIATPTALEDTGFQLTFAAVASIILVAAPLSGWSAAPRLRALGELERPEADRAHGPAMADWRIRMRLDAELAGRGLWPRRLIEYVRWGLVEILIVTVVVQVALVPWSVESYHRLSPATLPLNILGALVATVVTPIGLLLMILPDVLAAPPALIVRGALGVLVGAVDLAMALPGATMRVPSPPATVWAVYGLALSAAALFATLRWPHALAVTSCILAGLIGAIAFGDFSPRPPGFPVLTFIDVGQGDATLVELPDGRRILVDAGGVTTGAFRPPEDEQAFSIGEDVVTPYLFSRGIRHLDAIVMTHAHHDHMDGLFDVMNNFRVGELWLGRNPAVPRYRDLLIAASRHNVPIRWWSAGDRWAGFEAWNPPATYVVGSAVRNDDSLVLRLMTETGDALLTGDLERDIPGVPDHVTVLKVPHHGSRNTRLNVRADLPVISVGATNSFGHPHAEKLPALRTDTMGMIRITLTPGRPEVRFSFLE